MKTEIKDIENSQKEISFDIPYKSFVELSDKELEKILPTVKVPGFRAGKAPIDVIRKQHAHKIKSNAIERLVSESMSEAFVTNEINPLSQPIVSDMVFEENEPITFKIRFDIFPKLTLENLSDFKVEKLYPETTDKDIDKTIEEIRERHLSHEPVTDGRATISGDMVVMDFLGKVDNVPFAGGEAKDFSLVLGSGKFIPGFEDQVIGMKQDEVRDITVTFPEVYQEKSLAGKDAVFTVTINGIKEQKLPKIDDEFAKDIDPKCSTLKELKSRIKKALVAEADNSSRHVAYMKLLKLLSENNIFDVPYSFVREQAERLAYNSMSQFHSMGLDPESMGINQQMIIDRHIGQAKEQVKHALLINEISRMQGIKVEESDISEYFDHHAELQDRDAMEIRSEIESGNQLEALRNDLLGHKVYDYLATVNKITEKVVSREEYDKYLREQMDSNAEAVESKPSTKKVKSIDTDSKDSKPAKTAKSKTVSEDGESDDSAKVAKSSNSKKDDKETIKKSTAKTTKTTKPTK